MAARVPANDLTIQNIFGLLIRSRLVGVDQARALMERWEKESSGKTVSLRDFAAYLVETRHVTEYQAGLLLRGFAEGFFVGPYRILDRLGSGKMAGVYKAQHELGQVFALKVLPPSSAKDPKMLARFVRESGLAIQLNHPNVVRGFQLGESNGLHYFAMEFLSGETLKETLKKTKMTPGDSARVAYQVLKGLQHLHEKELVHRDIKPENLMLVGKTDGAKIEASKATVKILDIGLGRPIFTEDDEIPEKVTETGVLVGTPDYMAPEQARNSKTVDIRGDIYSTGCVLYHMLTGMPPFPDSSLLNQMIRHATEQAKPPHEINSSVPVGLSQLTLKLMEKKPEDRYQDPISACKVLMPFVSGDLEGLATPEADAKMKPYFTWLESEKHQSIEISNKTIPTGPSPVSPLNQEDPFKDVGPKSILPEAELSYQQAPVQEGVTARELVFFVIGTLAGSLATAAGCYFGLKKQADPVQQSSSPLEEKR
jgi:serine/threonine protein kinase